MSRIPGEVRMHTCSTEDLKRIATGDWRLLQNLSRLLMARLDSSSSCLPVGVQPEMLRSSLTRFSALLRDFPATLRYDSVHLKREQVNPDYEHLWLRFEEAEYEARRWPELEFRLSCAHVRPGQFGLFPKLEFPEETGRAPFENWFIEAQDDFGTKLELRFALPEGSMDVQVWQRISDRDRGFLLGVMERLPAILLDLQGCGTQIKRAWEDWVQTAAEMHRVAIVQSRRMLRPAPVGVRLSREFGRIASLLGIGSAQAPDVSKPGGLS